MQQPEFTFFWGERSSVFSNFYPAKFVFDGIAFTSSEQCYQYQKAVTFGDTRAAEQIANTTTSHNPGRCKRLGRRVANYSDEVWSAVREEIMEEIVYCKFAQNQELGDALLDTSNDELVEASPYDKFWGIGLAPSDERRFDKTRWRGKNALGECLMRVRDRLQEAY